ncbi:hypothetical protein [Cupriavidus sp. a3]|uniref:hypothetical protein n=1 Tax=Cupriavidus sp. a3 TaxID=3242158 RepID=UPI003D9C10BA
MTATEQYALGLGIYCLIGTTWGQASAVASARHEGIPLPIGNGLQALILFAALGSIVYGWLALRFVDGPHFVWVPAVVALFIGIRIGNFILRAADDGFGRTLSALTVFAVPGLFHLVL